ncbi:CU044_5270 family protein [Streptomyces sp. G2]|uniref:CU044_5270 family protein n=1 Tax=Streptomyces sp. G2 TaxID=1684471 RepID=UPI00202E5704|nr:CU044_5270 family protein [Streptomyces sp. G2]MCM1949862.1 CU044_5270 family protein [Streptomyces sp. G2]
MNDIDPRPQDALRAELTELLPPPAVPEFAPERRRELRRALMASARPARPAAWWTRKAVRFAVPAVVCGVAAGAVLVATPPEPREPRPAVRAEGGAAAVLSRAALAAASAPAPDARPRQFVYVESLVSRAGLPAGGGAAVVEPVHRRQVWLSADGSRPGLLREEGSPDSELSPRVPVYELDGPGAEPRKTFLESGEASVTDPTHAFVAGLPTDPEALLRLVREQTRTGGGDADQRAFAAIGTLLAETWAPPKVTAALFEAAARIPGVVVVPSARDAAGREGVAVARTAGGERTQWVFDRSTSGFLGARTVLVSAAAAGPAGTVLSETAVLRKAAVARAGQLPG